MTEPDGEDGVIVVSSVTVAETLGSDGELQVTITNTGDPTVWHQYGMLCAGVEALRLDLASCWRTSDPEDDDD